MADIHDDNIATIRGVYDAMARRDADQLQSLFAEDAEMWQTPELPWGGSYSGHDGMFAFFLTLVEHIDSRVTTETMYAAGEHVVQIGRTKGTVRASGAAFDVAEMHLWRVRDGKVVRFEAYIDTPAMLEALSKP